MDLVVGLELGPELGPLPSQTAMVVEFYGVIHAMEEAQKIELTNVYDLNVILSWFVLHLLLGLMFHGCFLNNDILVLITVRKSGLGLLIFFVRKCGC